MKVQLIVVQGKPEGKVIPLIGPTFRVGRGETCHLKPNSEQVSREHAEFSVVGDRVTVRDLGSRNGTLVNGKALKETYTLKDRDLVQIGPLTFAVAIEDAPVAVKAAAPAAAGAAGRAISPDDVSHDDIESWLVSDSKSPTPERPSGVYGGDTITINAFKDTAAAKPKTPQPATSDAEDEEFERLPEGAGDPEPDVEEPEDDEVDSANETVDAKVEDFVDESNPFHVKKKAPEQPSGPSKEKFADTSDAAGDILRKLMDRRRGSK